MLLFVPVVEKGFQGPSRKPAFLTKFFNKIAVMLQRGDCRSLAGTCLKSACLRSGCYQAAVWAPLTCVKKVAQGLQRARQIPKPKINGLFPLMSPTTSR